MNTNDHITVVYLSALAYDINDLISFLNSYEKFEAGMDHELLIVLNGTTLVSEETIKKFKQEINNRNIKNCRIITSPSGQDIHIYSQLAETLSSGYLLFLNSFSVLKANNWLRFFTDNYTADTGVIGATGSNASFIRAHRRRFKIAKGFAEKFRQLKYIIKLNTLYRNKFGKFPNPHIRTTGFFISRKLFLSLELRHPKIKREAWYFENGSNGMTRQLLKRGLKCKVVGRNGKAYNVEDWKDSNTFWNGEQENNLIADNHVKRYEEATEHMKNYYKIDAWGK